MRNRNKQKHLSIFDHDNEMLINSEKTTMNPGFYPFFDFLDEPDISKCDITLYLKLLSNINVENCNILDFPCGRGGGAAAYKKYLNINNVYAADINKNIIDFCQKKYPDINFSVMDADNIKYQDNFFDIVTSIDSLYGVDDLLVFFYNIKRILKSTGVYIFAEDSHVINNEDIKILNSIFNNIIIEDITTNVIDSCNYILENCNNWKLSKNELEYVNFSYKNNLDHYSSSQTRFIQYTCFNDDLLIKDKNVYR